MPAAGGQAIQITHQGGYMTSESPDGRFLYYAKERTAPGIWRVPVAGGEETLVLDHPQAGGGHWAVVEQGIFFAWARKIEFFSFATGKIKPVTTLEKGFQGGVRGLAVSPDGRWLIWQQLDQEGSDIMLMVNFR